MTDGAVVVLCELAVVVVELVDVALCVWLVVVVVVAETVGVGVVTTPGSSISPAKTGRASTKVKTIAEKRCRTFFIVFSRKV